MPQLLNLKVRKRIQKKPTIVIIDDDEDLSKNVYQVLLECKGYRVLTAKSGLAGLELLMEEMYPPDVVLVDCSMPQMDGETFLLGLRDNLPGIFLESKIIGFTSFDCGSPLFKKIKKHGFDCREKPFDMQGILKIVTDCLDIPSQSAHTRRIGLKINQTIRKGKRL